VKKIILIVILLLGYYYIFSNDNSGKKVIKNNVSKIKTENIDIEKEVKTFEENIVSDEKLEDNISDEKKTENEILVYSKNNDFSEKENLDPDDFSNLFW